MKAHSHRHIQHTHTHTPITNGFQSRNGNAEGHHNTPSQTILHTHNKNIILAQKQTLITTQQTRGLRIQTINSHISFYKVVKINSGEENLFNKCCLVIKKKNESNLVARGKELSW